MLLLTVPVWIGKFLVSPVTNTPAWFKDRSFHMIGLMLVSVVDNTIAAAELNTAAHYFAIFLIDMGAVAAYYIILS